MLNHATRPDDQTFPRLAEALDPVRAAEAFRAALEQQGIALGAIACTIERCRIKPGRKALIGLRLSGCTADGAPFDQAAMLTLYPGGEAVQLPLIAAEVDGVPSRLGPPTLAVPELAGKAWLFPNDRKVRHIARLLGRAGGTCEVLHYVPEQGCTVRHIDRQGSVLIGKCRADQRGAVAASLSAERFVLNGALRLARVTEHDVARGIVWQQAVPGEPLSPQAVLRDPALWAGRIGPAIAAFHALTPPPGLKPLTFASAGLTIAGRIARTAAAMPDFAVPLTRLGAALEQCRPQECAAVLTHGDLHPGNLLWDGQSLALIDLDTAALAPPVFDHATLTAGLIHKAIELGEEEPSIDAMVGALRAAFRREMADERAFDWALAASLLGERLYRCATRRKTLSAEHRQRLIMFAERRIACHA